MEYILPFTNGFVIQNFNEKSLKNYQKISNFFKNSVPQEIKNGSILNEFQSLIKKLKIKKVKLSFSVSSQCREESIRLFHLQEYPNKGCKMAVKNLITLENSDSDTRLLKLEKEILEQNDLISREKLAEILGVKVKTLRNLDSYLDGVRDEEDYRPLYLNRRAFYEKKKACVYLWRRAYKPENWIRKHIATLNFHS